MSLFHETIKQVLTEIEKFLTETLKKEKKLSKTANEHKQLILDKINKFYDDNPTMRTKPDTLPVKESQDESSMTGGSSNTDESEESPYIDDGVRVIPCADLTDPVCSGYLEKKSPKKVLFGDKFQKRWCLVKQGVMYYYVGPTDKKQHGAFKLEGYAFRNAPDLTSKKKEKELAFELYGEGDMRTYQFIAPNKEEYKKWEEAVQNGGYNLIEEDMYEEVEAMQPAGGNVAEKAAEKVTEEVPLIQEDEYNDVTVGGPVAEDVYEDADGDSAVPVLPVPPPPSPRGEKTKTPVPPAPPLTRQGQETPPPVPPASHRAKPGLNKPLPAAPSVPKPVQPKEEDEELYDDATSQPPPLPVMSPPALRPPPEIPLPPIPPSAPPKKKIKINITCKPEEDFDNRFYGKWDCSGDTDQELTFKQGDIIYILSREFDDRSWWVGELQGKFGLVPKDYLVPAFEKVK